MVSPNLNGNGAAADESVVRPGSERDVPADAGGQSVPEFDDDLVDDLDEDDDLGFPLFSNLFLLK